MSRRESRRDDVLVACVAMLAVACGGSKAATAPSPVASTPGPGTPVGIVSASSLCTARPNTMTGPATDPNGPAFHQVVVARTTDGLTLTDATIVQSAASVPDGVRAADGRTLVYYVNGLQHGIWVGVVSGASLAPIGPITIDGVRDPGGVVDPDAYRVGDRVRLAYLAGFTTASERAICIAESDDGVTFRTLGLAVDLRGLGTVTDPSVVRLGDGTWLMALSAGQQTMIARSVDGLAFTTGERLTYGGVPEVAIAPDGAVRLYVCAQGIVAYRSTDTFTWTREQTVVTRGPNGSMLVCDPSLVGGTGTFVFKTGS